MCGALCALFCAVGGGLFFVLGEVGCDVLWALCCFLLYAITGIMLPL